jgi:hypothetical protein
VSAGAQPGGRVGRLSRAAGFERRQNRHPDENFERKETFSAFNIFKLLRKITVKLIDNCDFFLSLQFLLKEAIEISLSGRQTPSYALLE